MRLKKDKLERINYLAAKKRTVGLTEEEAAEQSRLRNEYREAVLGSLRSALDRVEILEPDGSVRKIRPKEDN